MNSDQPRVLTDREREIIVRLLERDFPGRESILEQVNHSLVNVIDENGSLRFDVRTEIKSGVKKRIPVEAESTDADGVTVHFLLHVVHGKVNELEIYKDDSSKLIRWPKSGDLHLLLLAPMPNEQDVEETRGDQRGVGDSP